MPRGTSPKQYLDEARFIETTTERLEELARMEWEFVREAVAGNPRTSAPVLRSLIPETVRWQDDATVRAVAVRLDAPVDVLARIAQRVAQSGCKQKERTFDSETGLKLCSNPSTPITVIAGLLQSSATPNQFRRSLASRTCRRDVLELLLHDPSEAVRRKAKHGLTVRCQEAENAS